MIASLPAYFLSMGEKFGKPEKVSKPIICLSKLTCSKIALNYAKVINPPPNKTPHSIIEPGTSKIFLKISYRVRNVVKFCLGTYFAKF